MEISSSWRLLGRFADRCGMIKNVAKGTMLAMEYAWCGSLFSRIKGLMFARHPKALIMAFPKEQKVGIHMMFVFFPIDALWLDLEQKVVAVREELKPWTTAAPSEEAKYVVELPSGAVKASGTCIGDRLAWTKL